MTNERKPQDEEGQAQEQQPRRSPRKQQQSERQPQRQQQDPRHPQQERRQPGGQQQQGGQTRIGENPLSQSGNGPENEGEGSRSAAHRYNEAQTRFAREGRVDEAAQKARQALDGEEGDELEQAEEEGRSRAHEHDPEETLDYSRKT